MADENVSFVSQYPLKKSIQLAKMTWLSPNGQIVFIADPSIYAKDVPSVKKQDWLSSESKCIQAFLSNVLLWLLSSHFNYRY